MSWRGDLAGLERCRHLRWLRLREWCERVPRYAPTLDAAA